MYALLYVTVGSCKYNHSILCFLTSVGCVKIKLHCGIMRLIAAQYLNKSVYQWTQILIFYTEVLGSSFLTSAFTFTFEPKILY
jgi:hypothetical protein